MPTADAPEDVVFRAIGDRWGRIGVAYVMREHLAIDVAGRVSPDLILGIVTGLEARHFVKFRTWSPDGLDGVELTAMGKREFLSRRFPTLERDLLGCVPQSGQRPIQDIVGALGAPECFVVHVAEQLHARHALLFDSGHLAVGRRGVP